MVVLYRQLEGEARRAVLLDGLVIMAAAMTFVFANWLHQSFLPGEPGGRPVRRPDGQPVRPARLGHVLRQRGGRDRGCASRLRIEPSRRGLGGEPRDRPAGPGLAGLDRPVPVGQPDTIEPMDFIFPAGALIAALRRRHVDAGERRRTTATSASPAPPPTGCRSRPSSAARSWTSCRARGRSRWTRSRSGRAPWSAGRHRQRILQGRARRLGTADHEMSERAATTVSLARLEAAPTIEGTAERDLLGGDADRRHRHRRAVRLQPHRGGAHRPEGSTCRPVSSASRSRTTTAAS
jgi:hypothetical protein